MDLAAPKESEVWLLLRFWAAEASSSTLMPCMLTEDKALLNFLPQVVARNSFQEISGAYLEKG